jgi:hypothetical protein
LCERDSCFSWGTEDEGIDGLAFNLQGRGSAKGIEKGSRSGGEGVIISTSVSLGKVSDDKGDDRLEEEVELRILGGVHEKGHDGGDDEVLDDGGWG